jgi:hypothetical protein
MNRDSRCRRKPSPLTSHTVLWRWFNFPMLLHTACVLANPPMLEAPFARVTDSVIGADRAMSITPAWGDYDNDGWLDLFISNTGSNASNWLFRNNRDGTFTKITDGPLVTDFSASPFGAAWGDFNNDGWLDLAVTSHTGSEANRLYRNDAGTFSRVQETGPGSIGDSISESHAVSWGDFDADGSLDLFVANGALGRSTGTTSSAMTERAASSASPNHAIATPSLSSSQGIWSDYDGDGDLDLLVTHSGHTGNSLFRNQGGQFLDVAAQTGLVDRGDSVGAAFGDYDNDGDLDLFITNVELNGPLTRNFLYRNEGDGTFRRLTTGVIAEDQDHFVSGIWVDVDNDGWLDLFVTVVGPGIPSPGSQGNRLYRNQRDGTFARVTRGSLVTAAGNAGGCAWGDYNNDGFPDVCVAYGSVFSPQASALYRNTTNANAWLKVRCVGMLSNRSAIGAKVRVLATIDGVRLWQMRQITGAEGWVSFSSLDALFGLGTASTVETLRVEWPSGRVQEFHNLPVKQTLTLVESTTLSLQAATGVRGELVVRGPRQQRYRLEESSNLRQWNPLGIVTITNANGAASFPLDALGSKPHRFYRAMGE